MIKVITGGREEFWHSPPVISQSYQCALGESIDAETGALQGGETLAKLQRATKPPKLKTSEWRNQT